jgi:hemoglobin
MKRVLTVMMLVGSLFSASTAGPLNAYAQEESSKKEKKEKKKSSDDETSKKKQKSSDEEMAKEKKSSDDETSKKKQKKTSLYVRLGGKKSIQAVVDEFINVVAADTRINKFFAETAKDPKRLNKFNKNLVDQICEASGGPCKYKGKDMKAAHLGMGVSEADFNALVEDLVKALDKFNVGAAEKDQLLAALGPMKGDIVEK